MRKTGLVFLGRSAIGLGVTTIRQKQFITDAKHFKLRILLPETNHKRELERSSAQPFFFSQNRVTMSNWRFRPSILYLEGYKDANLFRQTFLEYYQRDNERATEEADPAIPPRSAKFRTLQWNLNGWAGDSGRLHALTHSKQIISTILQADADFIILNEYHWGDYGRAHAELEAALQRQGYHTKICGNVFCPTFVATRWSTSHKTEWVLSRERSALVLQVVNEQGESLTVIGTHLDHRDGEQRHREMSTLLQELFCRQRNRNPQEENDSCNSNDVLAGTRIILAGDLNQQRQKDYSEQEWNGAIAPNMMRRKTCFDDGVDKLLQSEGFMCAWDTKPTNTNWTTEHPPSTHWSGTIVDYSYGRNVAANSIYISPAKWSDHRMTLVDWTW